MKSILYYISNNKILRLRFLFLFLVLVYIPILLNMFFVYSRTMNAVKKEKMDAIGQTLQKTGDTLALALHDVGRIAYEASSNSGLRKAVQDFEEYNTHQKDMLTRFYRKEFETLESNEFIDGVVCITKDGRVIFTSGDSPGGPPVRIDGTAFLASTLYKDFSISKSDEVWHYADQDAFITTSGNKPPLFILQKLKGVAVEKSKPVSVDTDVGYMFTVLNPDALVSLISSLTFSPTGEVCFYDQKFNAVLAKPRYPVPAPLWGNTGSVGLPVQKEIELDHRKYAVGTAYVNSLGWYIASVVPADELVGTISAALKGNFWLIAFVSLIAAMWVILEVLVLSKLVTHKEMADYRLLLTQESNEKLKIYKHDFANHLQIVQGLIQMEQPERALEYLSRVAGEGKTLRTRYEIGIPELESAIFSSIAAAREHGIEVRVDTIGLPADIGVKMYDLTKILVNLIKNAMYALIKIEAEEKILTIKIYDALDEYVFEVSNNVPRIPEALRGKIFEKGFSTKGDAGSGLGLYIVRKLAAKNHGEVDLRVDDAGNHFIVRFPQKGR